MRTASNRQILITRFIEVVVVSALPALASRVPHASSGSAWLETLAYALVPPFVAAFLGLGWALASAALSVAFGAIAGLALAGGSAPAYLAASPSVVTPIALASAAAAFAIAFARSRLSGFRSGILERYRTAVHAEGELLRQNEVLEKVNRVLEGRISSQKDSITFLHDQVRKLASLDFNQALDTMLETISVFTEMSSGAVWRYDEEERSLVPAAVWGWSTGTEAGNEGGAGGEADPPLVRGASLDPETTVEGYVLRNRKPFSARMLLQGSEFDRFDTSRSIITLPLVIGAKAWGVLSVEDLPFERYSQYTETILAILLSLSEPYLKRILEYETLNNQNEVDADTGFPLFSILYRTLESDLERLSYEKGFVSLVILEILNYGELARRWGKDELKRMVVGLKSDIDKLKKMKGKVFHFKEDNQIVLLAYDLDQDGTSFFCLELLSLFSEYRFVVGDQSEPVEIIVGFSTSVQAGASADGLIAAAEHLLSVQRL